MPILGNPLATILAKRREVGTKVRSMDRIGQGEGSIRPVRTAGRVSSYKIKFLEVHIPLIWGRLMDLVSVEALKNYPASPIL